MLEPLRKFTGSWVFKIMIALLIASFGIWGIGSDMLGNVGRGKAPIKVGNVTVGMDRIEEEYRNELKRYEAILQMVGDQAGMFKKSILNQTVGRLVQSAVLDMVAQDQGVVASREALMAMVEKVPAFQNAEGKFDFEVYKKALASNGMTPAFFEDSNLRVIRQTAFMDSITANAQSPAVLAEALFRFREEKRTAEMVTIAPDSMTVSGAPAEDELKFILEANADRFSAPEYRKITALVLGLEAVASQVTVDEARIKALYEEKIGEFTIGETRAVRQLLIEEDAQLEQAKALIAEGKNFDEIANALGLEIMDLGAIAVQDMTAQFSQVVFTTEEGGITAPLESDFGWQLFNVASIEPEKILPLDEVRGHLEQTLRAEMSIEAVYKLSADIEDALGGGASLEEAGAQFGLTPLKIDSVDDSGLDANGKPVEGLPVPQQFLQTAFGTEAGMDSPMVESPQGYYILRVDSVVPAAPRALDDVREDVLAIWTAEEKRKAAEAKAAKLLESLNSGGALSGAVTASEPFTRKGLNDGSVTPDLAAKLFAVDTGGVAMAETDGGFTVARLKEILPADPATEADALAKLSAELTDAMSKDLAGQFLGALYGIYEIQVDQTAVESLL